MSQILLPMKMDSSYTKNDPFEWCRGICFTARKGERCKNFPTPGSRYCHWHRAQTVSTLLELLDQYRYDACFICTCCGHHKYHGCKDNCEVNNVIDSEAGRQSAID